MSAQNCKTCTAWRKLSDFKPFSSGHISHVCRSCEKIKDRERALLNYYKKHEINKIKQRSRAEQRRRKAGIPERGRYKRKHNQTPASTQIDLMLRFRR